MTLEELKTLRTFIEARFGKSEKWSDDKLPALGVEFAHVRLDDAQKAVRLLFDEGGTWAPAPGKVKNRARGVAAERVKLEQDARRERPDAFGDGCRHRWGILSDVEIRWERERLERRGEKTPREGLRLAVCVFCHTEEWGRFPTQGETESAVSEEAA